MHHIIDPRTGKPADGDLMQVTVIAPTAVEADIYAKTALMLGAERAVPFLESRDLPGLLVRENGFEVTDGWPDVGPELAA
jgi:thiamine biosynthesis lipoprotein